MSDSGHTKLQVGNQCLIYCIQAVPCINKQKLTPKLQSFLFNLRKTFHLDDSFLLCGVEINLVQKLLLVEATFIEVQIILLL